MCCVLIRVQKLCTYRAGMSSNNIPLQCGNTCLTVLSGKGERQPSLIIPAAVSVLFLFIPLSLTRIEVCNLFPGCVIQCGAALCSPEERKQLPASLIHTGALNSFYAQHPTHRFLRPGDHLCVFASSAAHLVS